MILALDSDFLGLDWQTPLPTKQFSTRRRVASEEDLDKMNRLYSVESQFSLTGANADHRLRMRGSEVKQFAIDLAAALGAMPGPECCRQRRPIAARKFLAAVVKDLKAAGPGSAGGHRPASAASVHALALLINQTLGSLGTTIDLHQVGRRKTESTGVRCAEGSRRRNDAGQVSTLVMLGGNPAYTAPADLQFAGGSAKVANSIHLGADDDETAAVAKWHLPEAHYLESWGDAVAGRRRRHPAADDRADVRRPDRRPKSWR